MTRIGAVLSSTILFALSLDLACQPATTPGAGGPRTGAATGPRSSPRTLPKDAHYVGSATCGGCHKDIYDRWKKTPMANVVRDPREHPDAILSDPTSNPIAPFTPADVAFVYGSRWKQRYFVKSGDDYYPLPVQWDVTHRVWKKYFVENGTDWWTEFYPPDNKLRPTGPLCDGCHSVGYDAATRKVAEWNVGCERCHGPGSAHATDPRTFGVVDPGSLDAVDAVDVCVQCHSQGRPKVNPVGGRYYDWPLGYQVAAKLSAYWELEEHRLGETTFTHYADGTAHKNRMQGNDFVKSLMYTRGVTCQDCHDVHGTSKPGQLRKPASELCLGCHKPGGHNGPFEPTIEGHTHHATNSAGSQCIVCHMPAIETTIGDVRVRAHTFEIVMPAMTDKYNIPNSCNGCHSDRTTQWATGALDTWKGRSPWRVRP